MIKKLKRYSPYQIIGAFIVIVGVAVVGSILLFQSHAATSLTAGVYEGAGNVSGVQGFAKETNTQVGIAADYNGGTTGATTTWADIDSEYPASSWTGKPYLLQLGVPMLPGSGASLATGATGAYNSYFTTLAQNLVKAGESNAILHIGWEWDVTGSYWYANGSTTEAANYAAYWKQIVTAMRAVPGADFNYSWYYGGASTDGIPSAATAITNAAWPGSAYVSSIDLDLYDQTWTGSCGLAYNLTAVPTPASQTTSVATSNCVWTNWILPELNGYASFAAANNVPMGFGEWGVITRSDGHGLGDDPTYINNMYNWAKNNNVEYMSYFDYNSGGNSVLSSYPQSLAAYSNDFGSTGSTTPPPPPVVNPPSVPANVSATANSSTSITVSWSASSDTGGPGLGGYTIYRNGTKLTTVSVTTTSYTDTSVSPSSSYYYTVAAYDTANPQNTSNQSTQSNTVKTPATPLPSAPTNVQASSIGQNSATISWTASTDTGGPGLKGYNVYVGTSTTPVNSSPVTTTSYTDSSLTANTEYSLTVKAVDTAGNSSVVSSAAVFTTQAAADTTPPSTPASTTATANSATSVTVTWSASTDSSGGGGIKGYYILRSTNGTSYTTLTSVTGTSYTDTSVGGSTTYYYEIEAYDVAGNVSSPSTAKSITTPAATTPAPAAPSNVTATAVTPTQINIFWSDSSSGITSYEIFEVGNASPIAVLYDTGNSYGDSGLNSSTSYSFYVVAYDGSVASPNSATVSATTQPAVTSTGTYIAGTITGIDNKCVDNNDSSRSDGNKIDLWSCNGTGAQTWTYNPANGTIVNSNGYCLNVQEGSNIVGSHVTLYTCNGSAGQSFNVKAAQGVATTITNRASGLCIDDREHSTYNGNPIIEWTCTGGNNQMWVVN